MAALCLLVAGVLSATAREGAKKIEEPGYSTVYGLGDYVVTRNLTATHSTVIYVAQNDVTIDLNGFTLATESETYNVISCPNTLRRLTIQNGFIRGSRVTALNLPGEDIVLRNLTITDCVKPIWLGEGGVIENCIIAGNRVTDDQIGIELGKGACIRNSIIYGNVFDDDGILVQAARNSRISRTVISGNEPGTNGLVSLVEGDGMVEDCVISHNDGALVVRGVCGTSEVRRTVFSENSASREVYGFVSNRTVSLCVAYDNDSTQSLGNWVRPFSSIQQVLHCISCGHTMDYYNEADGFYDDGDLRGCVAYENHGDGFLVSGGTLYCVAMNNTANGFVPDDNGTVRNCLAADNGEDGLDTPSEAVEVQDNHFSGNYGAYGLSVGADSILLRNSIHGGAVSVSAVRHGHVLTPTAGSAINTDNPFVNFKW